MFSSDSEISLDTARLVASVSRQTLQTSKFYVTFDKKSFLHFDIKSSNNDVFLVSKNYGKNIRHYKESINDRKKIMEFVNQNVFPKVSILDSSNSQFFLESGKLVIFGVFLNSTESKIILKEFDMLADIYVDNFFVMLDGVRWGKYLKRVYDISQNDLPLIFVLNSKSKVFYMRNIYGNKISISSDQIQSVIKDLNRNKLKVYFNFS